MKRSSRSIVFLLGGFFLALQLFSALNVHWSDSELWSITIARGDFLNPTDQSGFYKPLFFAFNALATKIFAGNLWPIYFSRLLYGVIGALGVLALVQIAKQKLAQNKNVGLLDLNLVWVLVFLFSFSVLLSQGYRVRSDLIASVCCLWALCFFEKSNGKEWRLPSVLQVLAVLITPKAIIFVALNLVYYVLKAQVDKMRPLRNLIAATVGLPILLIAGLLLADTYAYAGAYKYLLSTFASGADRPGGYTLEAFAHLRILLKENIHVLLAAVVAILGWIVSKKKDWPFFGAATFGILSLLLFPDRLPFFNLAVLWIPLLWIAINAPVGLRFLTKQKVVAPVALLTYALIGFLYWVQVNRLNSNRDQIRYIREMEPVINKYVDARYYDATGVLPNLTRYDVFPAPEQEWNLDSIFKVLSDPQLNLVFFGQRLHHYYPQVMENLEANYFVAVGPGVFAKAQIIDLKSKRIVGGRTIRELCASVKTNNGVVPELSAYAGDHFLQLQAVGKLSLCGRENGRNNYSFAAIKSNKTLSKLRKGEFLAISAEQPWTNDIHESFAQTFSDDSQFYVGWKTRIGL